MLLADPHALHGRRREAPAQRGAKVTMFWSPEVRIRRQKFSRVPPGVFQPRTIANQVGDAQVGQAVLSETVAFISQ